MSKIIHILSDKHLEIMLRDGWTPTEVRELIASYKQLKQLAARHKRVQSLISCEERASYRPANYAELTEAAQWAIDRSLGLLDWDGKTDGQTSFDPDGP